MNFDFDFIQEEHHKLQAFSSDDYDFEQINYDHHKSSKKEKYIFALPLRRRFMESSSEEGQESPKSKYVYQSGILQKRRSINIIKPYSLKMKKKTGKSFSPKKSPVNELKKIKSLDKDLELSYDKISELINEKIKVIHNGKIEDNEAATAYYLQKVIIFLFTLILNNFKKGKGE